MKTFSRYLFSWQAGLLGLVLLLAFFGWFFVLKPTVYQNWKTEQAIRDLSAAGCEFDFRAITPFEKTSILKLWNPEVKILYRITVPAGKTLPGSLLRSPSTLPSLAWIDFTNCRPTDHEFTWAARLPNIQIISIEGEHGISKRGFQAIPPGKEYILNLFEVPNLENDLKNLASAPCPVSLMIGRCQLNDDCFAAMETMTSLRQLSLTECDGISLEGLKRLRSLSLTSLLIRYWDNPDARLSDEMIAEIARMKTLEMLALPSPEPMSEESVEALKTLPKLNTLIGPSDENRDRILHAHVTP